MYYSKAAEQVSYSIQLAAAPMSFLSLLLLPLHSRFSRQAVWLGLTGLSLQGCILFRWSQSACPMLLPKFSSRASKADPRTVRKPMCSFQLAVCKAGGWDLDSLLVTTFCHQQMKPKSGEKDTGSRSHH